MATKVYIMGCTVDGLAFQTAQEGLQHYNGKKHRLKMTRFLKTISNEKVAVHIKGKCFSDPCLHLYSKNRVSLGFFRRGAQLRRWAVTSFRMKFGNIHESIEH